MEGSSEYEDVLLDIGLDLNEDDLLRDDSDRPTNVISASAGASVVVVPPATPIPTMESGKPDDDVVEATLPEDNAKRGNIQEEVRGPTPAAGGESAQPVAVPTCKDSGSVLHKGAQHGASPARPQRPASPSADAEGVPASFKLGPGFRMPGHQSDTFYVRTETRRRLAYHLGVSLARKVCSYPGCGKPLLQKAKENATPADKRKAVASHVCRHFLVFAAPCGYRANNREDVRRHMTDDAVKLYRNRNDIPKVAQFDEWNQVNAIALVPDFPVVWPRLPAVSHKPRWNTHCAKGKVWPKCGNSGQTGSTSTSTTARRETEPVVSLQDLRFRDVRENVPLVRGVISCGENQASEQKNEQKRRAVSPIRPPTEDTPPKKKVADRLGPPVRPAHTIQEHESRPSQGVSQPKPCKVPSKPEQNRGKADKSSAVASSSQQKKKSDNLRVQLNAKGSRLVRATPTRTPMSKTLRRELRRHQRQVARALRKKRKERKAAQVAAKAAKKSASPARTITCDVTFAQVQVDEATPQTVAEPAPLAPIQPVVVPEPTVQEHLPPQAPGIGSRRDVLRLERDDLLAQVHRYTEDVAALQRLIQRSVERINVINRELDQA